MVKMKAVIVAAGMSTRLESIVKGMPKSLVKIGGQSLLKRSIQILESYGIDDIFVVVGHEYQQIMDELGDVVTYVHNPWYTITNNMASLWFALHHLKGEEFLYLHSDLLYDRQLLEPCLAASRGDIVLLVEQKQCVLEDMKVSVDGDRFLFSSKSIPPEESFGEWTGIARFTRTGGQLMFSECLNLLYAHECNAYDTAAFTNLARRGTDIRIVLTDGLPWIEIDYPEDLNEARNIVLPRIEGGHG